MFSFTANGQLVAAVVVLVDAIFGVLVALSVIHVKPDQSIVALVVTGLFNVAGYIWALIQHQQHSTAMRMGYLPFQQVANKTGSVPPSEFRRK